MKMKSSLFLVAVVCVFGLNALSKKNSASKKDSAKFGRIVGGYDISIDKVPWIVQIVIVNDDKVNMPWCGGSIISVSRILTAAHCTVGVKQNDLMIRAGFTKSVLVSQSGGQIRKISKIINHPEYSHPNNDISIIILTIPLKLSRSVAVIQIANEGYQLRDGAEVLAAGWGYLCETAACGFAKTLQAVKVSVVGHDRCKEILKKYFEIRPTKLCAGVEKGGKDSCMADSGGPLTFDKTLVGIVSVGIGCAKPGLPGVYERVSSFNKWIQKYM